MITQGFTVTRMESVEASPNYNDWKPMPTGVVIRRVLVVPQGTVGGQNTVDLQMEDEAGNVYVTVLTAGLLEMMAKAAAT